MHLNPNCVLGPLRGHKGHSVAMVAEGLQTGMGWVYYISFVRKWRAAWTTLWVLVGNVAVRRPKPGPCPFVVMGLYRGERQRDRVFIALVLVVNL